MCVLAATMLTLTCAITVDAIRKWMSILGTPATPMPAVTQLD